MAHDLRGTLHWAEGRADDPTAAIFDGATRQSPPERGHRAGYDGYNRRNGGKIHVAVDTSGHLLARRATPADVQDRAQVGALAAASQDATGGRWRRLRRPRRHRGAPAAEAAAHGIRREVVKLPEAKRGFVLLPRRWVVNRFFAWASRCRRLANDHDRLPDTVAGLHVAAFVGLMLHRLVTAAAQSPEQALSEGDAVGREPCRCAPASSEWSAEGR